MNDFIIQCRGLTKNYGTKTALEQVEFSIGRGRIVGLLGPNGSGKTTLIKLLCGLLQPTSGELLIDGHTPGAYTKGQVSYLPDRMYVADWMKVRDLMGFFRDFYQDFDAAKASEMCQRLGIQEKDLDRLAYAAFADVCTPGNPREVNKEIILNLYQKVL